MRKILLVTSLAAIVASTLSSCGWSHRCTNTRSYTLHETRAANVGAPMIQSGCFVAQYESRGFRNLIGLQTSYVDEYFTPVVLKELLYAGREGSVLHLTYREFTGDGLARPAFYQNVRYDVSNSTSIVFQDWVLKVRDAKNEKIVFEVSNEPVRPEIHGSFETSLLGLR